MDASACGVFATVIPVLLLASYFSGHMIDLAVRSRAVARGIAFWGAALTVAECASLQGVLRGGVGTWWASVIIGVAWGSAGIVYVVTLDTIRQRRREARGDRGSDEGRDEGHRD